MDAQGLTVTDERTVDMILAQLRDVEAEIAESHETRDNLRRALAEYANVAGGKLDRPAAVVAMTQASERVTYDAKALDVLAALPKYRALNLHRKVSTVAGSLRVTWAKGGAA